MGGEGQAGGEVQAGGEAVGRVQGMQRGVRGGGVRQGRGRGGAAGVAVLCCRCVMRGWLRAWLLLVLLWAWCCCVAVAWLRAWLLLRGGVVVVAWLRAWLWRVCLPVPSTEFG